MIKILSAEQIKALDQATISEESIASAALMERASTAFVTWFTGRFNALKKTTIICGTGNNGGDGLAIARLLREWNYPVTVVVVRGGVPESADFSLNLARLREKKVALFEMSAEEELDRIPDSHIIIDALFGYGMSRPLEGLYAAVVEKINTLDRICVSVDMPSGLRADAATSGPVVRADYTLSFQLPKLPFFFPGYREQVGEWEVLEIGLSRSHLRECETNHFYLTQGSVKKILRTRSRFDHKGTFGHAMLVAGSYGKMGACVLAARAALRAGTGLLTIISPHCGYAILQTAVPEAMVITDSDERIITRVEDMEKADVTGVGPGLGTAPETVAMLSRLLCEAGKPVVLDADALNIISSNSALMHVIPAGSILTPHPKEFERLAGPWKDDFHRLEKLKALSERLQSVIVLKGAFTSVAAPGGRVYFNSTGNPGMATGGSGDVLTGILTGLMAQGYNAVEAALLGVYIHGLSGDLAVPETGMESLIASDLIEYLPDAFRQMKR